MRFESRARGGQVVMVATLIAIALGCSEKAAPDRARESQADPFTIYTVNYPLSYFADRMAPAGARVVFPVPEGIDPAFWRPSTESIQAYQQADLILLNGAGYAKWLRYATLPKTRMVITTNGCRADLLRTEGSVRHQHGPEGSHAHEGLAFTTWLDLRLAVCQASRVRDALREHIPEREKTIASGFDSLERDLLQIDARLRRAGEVSGDRPILASHPVYQYLADGYGLSIESLHLEPDQPISRDDWQALDAVLAVRPTNLMLWEAPPLASTQEGLRTRGVTVVVLDPAAQRPTQGDFLSVMKANADRLECATGVKPCR